MAIDIQKTGMCKNCTCCDYEIETAEYEDFDGYEIQDQIIKCKHEAACERMLGIMNKQKQYILLSDISRVPITKAVIKAFDPEFKFIDI